MTNTPMHLLPTSCYICGAREGESHEKAGHNYWSNEDASAAARQHDLRTVSGVMYASGVTTPEAAYVAEHRPY